jgi:hypothetical protein
MKRFSEDFLRLVTDNQDVYVPYSFKLIRDKKSDWARFSDAERPDMSGCITTPLTLKTAPAILGVMFGDIQGCNFEYDTRNVYLTDIELCAADMSKRFCLVEENGKRKTQYPNCVCSGFELRIHRKETIMVHLNISGDSPVVTDDEFAPVKEIKTDKSERFNEDGVFYMLDDEGGYDNISGFTLDVDKEGGCKPIVTIHRIWKADDLPEHIEVLHLYVRLFRDKYEKHQYGTFSITLFDLDFFKDKTTVTPESV